MSERTSPPIDAPEQMPATPPDVRGDDLKPTGQPATGQPVNEASPSTRKSRRGVVAVLLLLVIGAAAGWGVYRIFGPQPTHGPSDVQISRGGLVAAGVDVEDAAIPAAKGGHPLDPALEIARKGLAHIRADVDDYTARMVKRERVLGRVGEEETVFIKVRNRKMDGDKLVVPLSVYMRFLKPESKKGREVIWVENQNDGQLIAHDAGLARFIRAKLPTDGFLAMLGNRYPITEVGIENLVFKLIERGEKEKKVGLCEVAFDDSIKLNDRPCKLIELRHAEEDPKFEFFLAQIYIDKELFVPVRYAAYRWPEEEGGDMLLEEEYTYLDLKLNVGLTDKDFDPDNPDYEFP